MTQLHTKFTDLIGIEHPVMQDAMGTYKTVAIAAAVSEAGGLGTVSIPGTTVEPEYGARRLREYIEETMSKTTKPFAVNVAVLKDDAGKLNALSEAYIRTIIEARGSSEQHAKQVKVLTTSAGFPSTLSQEIRDAGLLHFHKVGSSANAKRAEDRGVDGIIAAGFEMGGHTHNKPVHTFVLGPNVADAVDVPVVLAGGVRDGRGLAAALCLGASAVGLGTRFVASDANTDWDPAYIQHVLDMKEGEDILFPGVFGPVRGLETPAVGELMELLKQNRETFEVNRWKDLAFIRAQEKGDFQTGLAPIGQVASGIHDVISVREFVPNMVREALETLQAAARLNPVTE